MPSSTTWSIARMSTLALVALAAAACGGSSSKSPEPATVPTGITAAGALRTITVSWDPNPDQVKGYNVYRSADGTTFTKRNSDPVSGTTYDDTLESPADDGVSYLYRVTAVGGRESDPSSTVRCMHGTRLGGTSASGISTVPAESPYVIEGTLTLEAGNFTVSPGTKLYVLDGAVIDLAAGAPDDAANGQLLVNGLLRVLASPTAHATITAHKAGGLGPDEGLGITFDGAPSYVPADDSGTLVQNTEISNLRGGNVLIFHDSAPKMFNSKIGTPPTTGYAAFRVDSGVIFSHCLFAGLNPLISTPLAATSFKLEQSVLQPSIYDYSLDFTFVTDPIGPGQITQNEIDGTQQVDLGYVQGSDIPLQGNYWRDGIPSIRRQGTTPGSLTCTFAPALSEAPAGVGPSW